jgi:flagellum-specific peptidoglycan hydrolase FlgJ
MTVIMQRYLFSVFLFLYAGTGLSAQKKQQTYLNYIDRYYAIAQKQQSTHRIPASITLAQGLLESGAGSSSLAVNAFNHFGIKCHSWPGECVYLRPNDPQQRYRKYKSAEDSFEDHANVLTQNSRYAVLFTYKITDYKSWAKGLQKCGYATDKAYASKLIQMIELYQLYLYDSGKNVENKKTEKTKTKERKPKESKSEEQPEITPQKRQPYLKDGLLCIRAGENDGFDKIARDMGFKVKDLLKYNEAPEGFPLSKNDIVYLQKKKKKAADSYSTHTVQNGESMHSISQQYGIQVKRLYKINGKKPDYVPTVGDVLRLR